MNKGQGSLEYILLIAGAILGAAMVIGLFITLTQSGETAVETGGEGGEHFIDTTIGDITTGLGGPDCGPNGDGIFTPGTQEECDYDLSTDPPTYFFPSGINCTNYEDDSPFTGGTLECGIVCNFRTDNCT